MSPSDEAMREDKFLQEVQRHVDENRLPLSAAIPLSQLKEKPMTEEKKTKTRLSYSQREQLSVDVIESCIDQALSKLMKELAAMQKTLSAIGGLDNDTRRSIMESLVARYDKITQTEYYHLSPLQESLWDCAEGQGILKSEE